MSTNCSTGVEELVPDGSVKLGFRTHYPQIETKLTVRGADMADIGRKLAPVEEEVRKRLGNFIIAEDDQTLEGVVLASLAERDGTLAVVETFTAGQIAGRIAHLPGAEKVFRRGLVARDPAEIAATLGLDGALISGELSREAAEAVAAAAREETGASHALAVLIEVDDGPDRIDFGGSIHLAIAAEDGGRIPPLAHLWRPRLGAPRRRRARPRLPAPLPPGPAGHRAHRFRAGMRVPLTPALSPQAGRGRNRFPRPTRGEG